MVSSKLSALYAISWLGLAACAGAANVTRPTAESYEAEWGKACGPGRRAAAPERYRAQVEQYSYPLQLSVLLLIFPERSKGSRSSVTTNIVNEAPPVITAEIDARWRAHAADAARCFGDLPDGSETFPILGSTFAPSAPDASSRNRCVHGVLQSAFAGLVLSEPEAFTVLYGRDAERTETMVRAARSEPVTGALTKAEIKRGIDAGAASIRSCYNLALAVWPTLAGDVLTRIIIAPDGTVDTSEIISSELDNPALECCISSAMATLVFEPPVGGGIVVVRFPYVFVASRARAARP